ncbi:cytochrome P450 [Mollisia scopiformis]|uniref:Cytochrome P450 n=1 Tax=Mollisia scopiformis TaxID=149040 RepID=A0A194WX33_MOLSC|nr:cytochrome P450 [Mollisia scopiformis]KUJ12538.1 cytochrome P450 [Mollisia scopiformis]
MEPRSLLISTLCQHSILLGLLILFAGAFFVRVIWSYRRLQAFKGPFWASISPIWLAMHTMSGKLHLRLGEVNRQYGSLARIAPNFLLTNDPFFLRRMSSVRSPYTKGKSYDGMKLDPDAQNTLSEKDEQKHTAMRAKVANGYAGKDNMSLESSIDVHVMDMVHLIENHFLSIHGAYRPMDLARIAQYFTVDVLTDIAFSRPFNMLKNNDDIHDYIETVRSSLPVLQARANIPFIKTFLEIGFLRRILPTTTQDKFGMGTMLAVAKEAAAERFRPDAKPQNDMLGSFVRNGLTQAQTAAEALLQIIVGVDSTATAVRTIMYHIMTNPRILQKLHAELDNAVLTRPVLLDSEAASLPYLQACIQEGLRHWPPIAALTLKVVPAGGDTYNGVFIPGGTEIAYSAWALHHSKAIFGQDADIYRPERWLEAEGEELREMKGTVDLVFGSGKYRCLGKKIAGLELNKIFAEMFLRFDFAVIDPQKGFKSRFHGLFMQSDMNVVVYPRNQV